ncbi:MAG: hypothetical protein P9M14_14080 [Candidatus Alcyoniella australis]|nr:hypothetical protein [Candidatus Alcyoniella australis]
MRPISAREKILIGAASAALVILMLILLSGSFGSKGAAVVSDDPRSELLAVQELAQQYAPIRARLRSSQTKIENAGNTSLLTTLESLASPLGIQIDEAINRSKPTNPHYREEAVEISLRGISLQQLAEYMLALRDSEVLLSIKNASIKSRARDASVLDVRLEISTFKPL